jgi:hypothetical protein
MEAAKAQNWAVEPQEKKNYTEFKEDLKVSCTLYKNVFQFLFSLKEISHL